MSKTMPRTTLVITAAIFAPSTTGGSIGMRRVRVGMAGAPHITPWDACDTRQPNEGMVGHRISW
jgi:hypothetical protein